jgi:predicted acylesterase/phospholipase RssA
MQSVGPRCFFRVFCPTNLPRFVCVKAKETNHISRLRAYRLRGRSPDMATIWEAALATSAAPTFFDPVQIGERTYVDGAMGANNPSFEVEKEASNIWCEVSGKLEPLVKMFISIGTGNPGINPVSDRAWKFVSESIVKVATETSETEEMFSSRWRGHLDTRYFRFNVEQGLQNLGLAEYQQLSLISAATDEYLESHKTGPRVRACVLNLRKKRCLYSSRFRISQRCLTDQCCRPTG